VDAGVFYGALVVLCEKLSAILSSLHLAHVDNIESHVACHMFHIAIEQIHVEIV